MPPKKDLKAEKGQQKAIEKQKAKIAEDKTFGLKNKNKSKQVQKYIKGIHQAVKGNQNVSQQTLLEQDHQKKEEKKKKLQQEALLASLFKGTQNVAKLDLKNNLKTDPSSIKEEQAIDIYVDKRDKRKCDTMDSWDIKKLEEVIKVKHGSSHSSKPTDIVCKHFLDALEKKQYGWFWVCPNNGDNCKYRHSLPPGYVMNKEIQAQPNDDDEEMTLEELIEQERAALPYCEENITLESFNQWKLKKEKERLDKVQRDRLAETKRSGVTGNLATLSGRDLFTFNPALFIDDAGAADEADYQEEEDYWNTVTKENQAILDTANEKATSKNNSVEEKNNEAMNRKKTDNVQETVNESKIFISKPCVFLDGDVPKKDTIKAMWRIFGYKKQECQQNVDLPNAIIQNKQAIETLEKRQAHLECRIAFQEQDAKRRAQNNDKRGALFALKRKKMFEKELEQLGSAHLTLEQQIITLESAQAQQVAVGALAAGVVAQKVLNQKLNLSKIDDLIEDMQEQSNLQNELAQVLSQDNHLCDDAELLNELHELEAQQLDEALADVGPVPIQSPGQITAPVSRNGTKHVFQSENPYRLSGNASSSSISPLEIKKSDEEEQLEKLLQELS